jgi:hypothetical protein
MLDGQGALVVVAVVVVLAILTVVGCGVSPTASQVTPKEVVELDIEAELNHPITLEKAVWTTTLEELRAIADKMDSGESLTGEGAFHIVVLNEDIGLQLHREGF